MAHISRIRKPKFEETKLQSAREKLYREAIQKRNHEFNATRRQAAAKAYSYAEAHKKNKTDLVPMGVFSFDELVYCRMAYGEEITKDADFWKFWRKANGQEFLKFL